MRTTGGTAHCTTRPSHLEHLMVIDDGVIIINADGATINQKLVTGTVLITYDEEMKVNDSVFWNLKSFVKNLQR